MNKKGEMTLYEHAVAWWKEHDCEIPDKDSDEWKRMYEEWVSWAFSDLRG